MVHQVVLKLVLVVHDNGDILMVRTQLSVILAVCLSILVKIFRIREKIISCGLGGLLLVRKGFSIAARVAYSADIFLKVTTVCLHEVIPEMRWIREC